MPATERQAARRGVAAAAALVSLFFLPLAHPFRPPPTFPRTGHRRPSAMPLEMGRDLYEVLGVPRGSDARAIKRGFREAARKYHPDVNSEPDAADVYKEISQAYSVLSDPDKKARYDQFGEAGLGGGGGGPGGGVEVNLEDIFDSFFGGGGVGGSPFGGGGGGFGRAQRTRGPAQGDDLRADLELDFKTACFGGQEKVRITHLESCGKCKGDGIEPGAKVATCDTCRGSGVVMQVTRTPLGNFQTQSACPTCQGTGQSVEAYCAKCNGQGVERKAKQVSVTIPCGVDAGNRLRVAGEGDAGPRGGAAGDLYIFLDVKKDPVFTRDGVDVASSMEVSAADAALGCAVATPTLDEESCEVKVPAGTQPGTKLRLKGKGAPALSKPAQRGDLYVTVNVKVPTSLSDEERRLMEQLRDLQAK